MLFFQLINRRYERASTVLAVLSPTQIPRGSELVGRGRCPGGCRRTSGAWVGGAGAWVGLGYLTVRARGGAYLDTPGYKARQVAVPSSPDS